MALGALLPWLAPHCLAIEANDYHNKAVKAYGQLRSFQVEAIAETDRDVACRSIRVRVPVAVYLPDHSMKSIACEQAAGRYASG